MPQIEIPINARQERLYQELVSIRDDMNSKLTILIAAFVASAETEVKHWQLVHVVNGKVVLEIPDIGAIDG